MDIEKTLEISNQDVIEFILSKSFLNDLLLMFSNTQNKKTLMWSYAQLRLFWMILSMHTCTSETKMVAKYKINCREFKINSLWLTMQDSPRPQGPSDRTPRVTLEFSVQETQVCHCLPLSNSSRFTWGFPIQLLINVCPSWLLRPDKIRLV